MRAQYSSGYQYDASSSVLSRKRRVRRPRVLRATTNRASYRRSRARVMAGITESHSRTGILPQVRYLCKSVERRVRSKRECEDAQGCQHELRGPRYGQDARSAWGRRARDIVLGVRFEVIPDRSGFTHFLTVGSPTVLSSARHLLRGYPDSCCSILEPHSLLIKDVPRPCPPNGSRWCLRRRLIYAKSIRLGSHRHGRYR